MTGPTPSRTEYIRRLGVFDTTMIVIGGIIGAGIFLNPAIVAQRVHTTAFILTTWVIGGAVALIGALCFAELGARRPQAGGGYVYLTEVFGPLPAFLYGWTFLFIINCGGIAAVSVTFARYTTDLFGLSTAYVKPLAAGLLVVLSGVNYLGVRAGSITQNIFTVLKLVALAALIGVGIFFAGGAATPASTSAYQPPLKASMSSSRWGTRSFPSCSRTAAGSTPTTSPARSSSPSERFRER